MGWYDIGWNNPMANSPIMTGMMKQGVQLTRHYASRFCAPYVRRRRTRGDSHTHARARAAPNRSRGMLMTGRMPWVLGLQSDFNLNPIESMRCMVNPDRGTFLPERLAEAGYRSYMVGKWHLGHYRDDAMPTARGFRSYVGYLNGATIHMGKHQFRSTRCACSHDPLDVCDTLSAPGQFCVTVTDMINATNSGWVQPIYTREFAHTDELLANEAVRLINNHDTSVPLFLYVAWGGPHDPNQSPSQFADATGIARGAKLDSSLYQQCGATVTNQRRNVLGMVALIDQGMDLIRAALFGRGMWDNTVVIFISDNGGLTPRMDQPPSTYCNDPYYGFNYPLRGRKYSFWEGGIRTVGFVYSPNQLLVPQAVQGTQYGGLVTMTDWRATILGLAQLPNLVDGDEGGMDSIDQWDSLMGNAPPARQSYVFQYWDQAGRYGAIWHDLDGNNHMYKLMIGWQGVGEGVGAMGPTQGLSPRDYLVAPPELDRSLLIPGLVSNGLGRDCTPGCMFDITADPYESNDLYSQSASTPQLSKAFAALQAAIATAGQTALSTIASGICAAGYAPESVDTPNDGNAMATAQYCGAYVPWMAAPGQTKIPCNQDSGGGSYYEYEE